LFLAIEFFQHELSRDSSLIFFVPQFKKKTKTKTKRPKKIIPPHLPKKIISSVYLDNHIFCFFYFIKKFKHHSHPTPNLDVVFVDWVQNGF